MIYLKSLRINFIFKLIYWAGEVPQQEKIYKNENWISEAQSKLNLNDKKCIYYPSILQRDKRQAQEDT